MSRFQNVNRDFFEKMTKSRVSFQSRINHTAYEVGGIRFKFRKIYIIHYVNTWFVCGGSLIFGQLIRALSRLVDTMNLSSDILLPSSE